MNRFVSEELSQVVSMTEGHDLKAPSSMALEFTPASSRVVAIRKPVEVAMPSNTEELRKRMAILKLAWQICHIKYHERKVMQDIGHTVWDRYLAYLLGEKVWGTGQGATSA